MKTALSTLNFGSKFCLNVSNNFTLFAFGAIRGAIHECFGFRKLLLIKGFRLV